MRAVLPAATCFSYQAFTVSPMKPHEPWVSLALSPYQLPFLGTVTQSSVVTSAVYWPLDCLR